MFGRNIAAAEAACVFIGDRVLETYQWCDTHHCDVLQLTDSLTTFMKFSSLRVGSHAMDCLRNKWLQSCTSRAIPTTCDYIPREFNVGSDLLSKGDWTLFCAVLLEAGLPAPTLVHINESDRDISFLAEFI